MSEVIPGSCLKCGNLVSCTCKLRQEHKKGCRFLRAADLGIELGCPHGFQACPKCDPCSCGLAVVGIR